MRNVSSRYNNAITRKFLTLLGLLLLSIGVSQEQPHFQGKTITFIVAAGAGGGTDVNARLVAEHLGRFIEGNPTIVVTNSPGGGGAIAFNQLYSRARPDGLTIGIATGGTPVRWLSQQEGHDYNMNEMLLLAGAGHSAGFYVGADVGSSVEDLQNLGRPVRVAHRDVSSGYGQIDQVAEEVWGFPVRLIAGYDAYGGDTRLAVLRGEADASWAHSLIYDSTMRSHVEEGEIHFLFDTGMYIGGELVRDPRMPEEVPLINEVYRDVTGQELEEHDDWPIIRAMVQGITLGTSFWLPPNTPEEIYDELVTAFDAMQTSEEFQAAAVAMMGAEFPISTGQAIVATFEDFANMPPEVVEKMQ
jgi:tripartite-type tricarboxylate transporter receptor subunit TctC